ncbi:hypothetical protein SAMD00019534_077830, partial [Acytostelium subglobosum LB1]|uniref:hypothetical protein n=1 Tax=Acytostelium subglobosum LB1 TaxID=1410327 RepID=UPI000644F09E
MYPSTYSMIANNGGSGGSGMSGLGVGSNGGNNQPTVYNSLGQPMGTSNNSSATANTQLAINQEAHMMQHSYQSQQAGLSSQQMSMHNDTLQQQMSQQLLELELQQAIQFEQLCGGTGNAGLSGIGTYNIVPMSGMSSMGGLGSMSGMSNFGSMGCASGMNAMNAMNNAQHIPLNVSPYTPHPTNCPQTQLQQQQQQQQQQQEQHDQHKKQASNLVDVSELSIPDGAGTSANGTQDVAELSKQLNLTKKQLEDERESAICSICVDRKKNTGLDCGHIFCNECVSWLGGRHLCPICRQEYKNPIRLHF